MGRTVQLLENALRGWEDLLLIYEARVRVGIQSGLRKREELAGPLLHWRELRKHLLEIRGADFDASRFCYREGGTGLTSGPLARLLTEEDWKMAAATNATSFYASLPMQLASWTVSSRRVFHLSDEMVERFLAADYNHYTWGDLLWPFDSFFIEFDSPVQDDHDCEYAGLLVSSVYGVCPEHTFASEEGFECLTFCTKIEGEVTPESLMDEKDRERLENDMRHKRWVKLNRRVGNVFAKMLGTSKPEMLKFISTDEAPQRMSDKLFTPPAGFGKPICWEKDQPIQAGPFGRRIGKVIAGLCLYLEALPPSVSGSCRWHIPDHLTAKRDVRNIVIDGELVCNVADLHTLSPETMTLFPETLRAGPSYSVEPHGRRGHWRRAPGQGNNPNAPRTIKVKPAIIHRDQIPEGAVIGGATTYVK